SRPTRSLTRPSFRPSQTVTRSVAATGHRENHEDVATGTCRPPRLPLDSRCRELLSFAKSEPSGDDRCLGEPAITRSCPNLAEKTQRKMAAKLEPSGRG